MKALGEMTEHPNFWTVLDCIRARFGVENIVAGSGRFFSGHPVWELTCRHDFDPLPHVPFVRPVLDGWGWQLVKTSSEQTRFAFAPRLNVELPETVYHVTKKDRFDSIMTGGLRPSTAARRHTSFPDTEAKIHASLRLETADGQGDGAAFWVREFPRKLGGSISDYGIIRVDVRKLPHGTRVYRDTHSHWGVVFDSLDRIEPHDLLPMADCDVEALLEQCGPHVIHED